MVIHTVAEAMARGEVWFKGDRFYFTGIVEVIYGGLFGEAKPMSNGVNVWIALKEE